jgi:orotidine-5'-phosphate decarboxylase
MTGFGERLHRATSGRASLCVGIDPHEALLRDWGLSVDAAGAREFGLRVVEAAASRVVVVKPQVAFFERFGSDGFAALEEVMATARAAGLIVLADAKRGDIGTTMDAYAAAWLTPGAPLEADAVTVTPYLGVGALESTFDRARNAGKGVFVLAATSNPEAASIQLAAPGEGTTAAQPTIAAQVIAEVSAANHRAGAQHGDIGFVIGATVEAADFAIPAPLDPPAPILAPGFGAQGARLSDVVARFGANASTVLASASRSILAAGPSGLAAAIATHIRELEEARDV